MVEDHIADQSVSPALHEFFQSHHHTLRKTIEPLSHDIPRQTTEKVKSIMLEMQDTARREVLRDHEVQNVSQTFAYSFRTVDVPQSRLLV